MLDILNYFELLLLCGSVAIFAIRFYWRRTKNNHYDLKTFSRIAFKLNIIILTLGIALIWSIDVNPMEKSGYWIYELIGAFLAYVVMTIVALDPNSGNKKQYLTFFGAMGWLFFGAKLAMTQQAIFFVG